MFPSAKFRPAPVPSKGWTPSEIAGRFVEVCGSHNTAALTLTFGMVLEVQQQGEPVGWVTSTKSTFYPPDVAQLGVDLQSLVVVRVESQDLIARAGEKLLRSGGFGLVVFDLGVADIPMPLQTRLVGLAHHHHTALMCLTEKKDKGFSLGSLVSLRVMAERKKTAPNEFTCALRILKDKRRGPTWTHEELHHGPPGLQ